MKKKWQTHLATCNWSAFFIENKMRKIGHPSFEVDQKNKNIDTSLNNNMLFILIFDMVATYVP